MNSQFPVQERFVPALQCLLTLADFRQPRRGHSAGRPIGAGDFSPFTTPARRPTWPGASSLIRRSSGEVTENRLTFESVAMDLARCRQFFLDADSATYHRQYEALRAIFVDGLPQNDVADKYGYTHGSMRQLVHQFRAAIRSDSPPPFSRNRGSGDRRTSMPTARPSRQRPPLPTSEPARSRG
jgi:hypothetical protein